MLSTTLGLAAAILGLNLMIESKILMLPQERWPALGKTLRLLALIVAVPIGIGLVVVGFIWESLMASFVSVGFTLIIVAITLLVKSKRLSDAKAKGGKLIAAYSWICVVIGAAAVMVPLVQAVITLTS